MRARKVGALILALMMTACASTPRPLPEASQLSGCDRAVLQGP